MTFESCTAHLEAQPASRIVCEGNKIKARYTNGQYRYEAVFNKKDDGWGGVEWTSEGAMTESEKVDGAAKVAKTPTEEKAKAAVPAKAPEEKKATVAAAPAVTAPAAAPAAAPAETFKLTFNGYADLRFTNYSIKDDLDGSPSGNAESGWGVEDGAFYATYEKDKLSLIFDIPFRRLKTQDDVDHTTAGTPPDGKTTQNASNTSTILFGGDKAQIYAKYKFNDYVAVDMGQFDTLYGVELNDSKDRIFGKTGLVYDQILPVTHTGGMVEVAWNGASFKTFSANSNNKGSYGEPDTGGDKTEYGTALGYSNDWFRTQAGYMSRQVFKANKVQYGNRTLSDFTIGATWRDFSADFEYASVSDVNKNTLTPKDSNDEESAGTGGLALLSYKINDPLLVGLRYERLKNDPGAASLDTAEDYGAAVHYKVSSLLELRSEFISYKYTRVDGTDWKATRFDFASLIYF